MKKNFFEEKLKTNFYNKNRQEFEALKLENTLLYLNSSSPTANYYKVLKLLDLSKLSKNVEDETKYQDEALKTLEQIILYYPENILYRIDRIKILIDINLKDAAEELESIKLLVDAQKPEFRPYINKQINEIEKKIAGNEHLSLK